MMRANKNSHDGLSKKVNCKTAAVSQLPAEKLSTQLNSANQFDVPSSCTTRRPSQEVSYGPPPGFTTQSSIDATFPPGLPINRLDSIDRTSMISLELLRSYISERDNHLILLIEGMRMDIESARSNITELNMKIFELQQKVRALGLENRLLKSQVSAQVNFANELETNNDFEQKKNESTQATQNKTTTVVKKSNKKHQQKNTEERKIAEIPEAIDKAIAKETFSQRKKVEVLTREAAARSSEDLVAVAFSIVVIFGLYYFTQFLSSFIVS